MNKSDELLTERIFDSEGIYGRLFDVAVYIPVSLVAIGQLAFFLAVILAIPIGILIDINPGYELIFVSTVDYLFYQLVNERTVAFAIDAVLVYIVYFFSLFIIPVVFEFVEKKIRAALTLLRRADLV